MGLGYPTTAAQAAAAVPGATFSHGWLCDELSGDLAPAFGGVTLTASGAGILYGDPGPAGAADHAIGFTASSTGKFSAADTTLFDISSTSDELVVAWVGRWSALPTAFGTICGKASAAFANGWSLGGRDGSTQLRMHVGPGDAYGAFIAAPAAFMLGLWHVGIAVIDRSGTDVVRLGVRELYGSTALLSSSPTNINGNTASTATAFTVGAGPWVPGNDNFRLAALYIGKGAGVATGLAANLSTALTSFANTIAQSTRVGQYTSMLLALLPPGKLWRPTSGSTLYKVAQAAADELTRVHGRADDMQNEADPSTTVELLPEWERMLGLDAAATTAERQAAIVSRMIARQRYRPVDIQQALAPLLGLDPADVDVIERTHAFAVSLGDQREIFRFFVYRNPALPGTYFVASAQALLDSIKPSHTLGYVIESVSFKCDDAFSLCDRDLLGA